MRLPKTLNTQTQTHNHPTTEKKTNEVQPTDTRLKTPNQADEPEIFFFFSFSFSFFLALSFFFTYQKIQNPDGFVTELYTATTTTTTTRQQW